MQALISFASVSNSLSKIKGECVTVKSNLQLSERSISGSNILCHIMEIDNSGSSIIRMLSFSFSRYSFENKETICFSPDDRFDSSILLFLSAAGNSIYSIIDIRSVFCMYCGANQVIDEPPKHSVKKRGNGTGSVYKLPNDKWACARTWYVGGKRKTLRKKKPASTFHNLTRSGTSPSRSRRHTKRCSRHSPSCPRSARKRISQRTSTCRT